ncbi:restriction endonuclease [Vibrio parahaemolyticus]|uniref:HNH endonuclease n=1 Tax=Vibrio parahaemolyticus TaxID=670 RepID=UPI0011203208|nr:HNH endonuclease [Vibrio parahaemolyticus]MDB6195745.1 HNH endonuclease [Vibrio parahaemolyticus]TNZ67878.1 restriction endonuclease [Vibrio parahaemolyticus]HCG7136790.1 HNH endonuclease [Vibrio parahaemolyticus]
MIKGKVRRTNRYADGSDYLEIHLKKSDCANLPFIEGERVNVDSLIDNTRYQVGLRMTRDNDYAWICPNAYAQGEKERLANVLSAIGLSANDEVLVEYRNCILYVYGRSDFISNVGNSLPEEVDASYYEGAKTRISVNKYERNQEAKVACLEEHGTTCVICGFNAEDTYGKEARNIIHVHHLTPISEVGSEYKVDPVADLRPVCPNCHAVIHRNNGCDEIENVKLMLSQQRAYNKAFKSDS